MENNTKCSLCLEVFLQPVTTPCGHTFCRECLSKNYSYSRTCPLCRAPILSDPIEFGINTILENYIKKSEYNEKNLNQFTD